MPKARIWYINKGLFRVILYVQRSIRFQEVRTTQAEIFRQIFDQIPDPTLLKTGDGWLCNTAAQGLCLTDPELEELEKCDGDASLWLAHRFFLVSAAKVDNEPLFTLRDDAFLASAARNVASQIRQRLQSAFGCTSDLSSMDAVKHDLRARDRLSGVNRELYQFLRMAKELELSGQDDGFIYAPEWVDLVKYFLKMADEARELCAHAGVKLELELEPSELLMLADAEKLNYLVLSLVSNSLAHAPQSGGQITLGLKRKQGQAVITVTDNGEGFSPDLFSHPLWSDPDRRLFGRGLGLGLPLVQRIAAAHEGTVNAVVDSSSSKCNQVVVSLPIRIPDGDIGEPVTPPPPPSGFSMAKTLLSNALPRGPYYPNPDGDD